MPARLRPALPVEPRDYFAFWRAPRYRWWKGLLAVVIAGVGFVVMTTAAGLVGLFLDDADYWAVAQGDLSSVGAGFFLGNNVGLALCLPLAYLTAWACTAQRPGWLSSVEGRLRQRWMFSVMVVLLPAWIAVNAAVTFLSGGIELAWRPDTPIMIAAVLFTTPLQAAAEEYLIRGLLGRAVASWFRAPVVGFAISTAVTAVVFMVLHGAGDPWLNAFYLLFGVVASWVTWRTGGLEVAVAIHVVHNMTALALAPFSDLSGMFDRSAGAGGPWVLALMVVLLVPVVLVEWRRKRGNTSVASTAP